MIGSNSFKFPFVIIMFHKEDSRDVQQLTLSPSHRWLLDDPKWLCPVSEPQESSRLGEEEEEEEEEEGRGRGRRKKGEAIMGNAQSPSPDPLFDAASLYVVSVPFSRLISFLPFQIISSIESLFFICHTQGFLEARVGGSEVALRISGCPIWEQLQVRFPARVSGSPPPLIVWSPKFLMWIPTTWFSFSWTVFAGVFSGSWPARRQDVSTGCSKAERWHAHFRGSRCYQSWLLSFILSTPDQSFLQNLNFYSVTLFCFFCYHFYTIGDLSVGRPGYQVPCLQHPENVSSDVLILRKEYAWHIGGALSQNEVEEWKLLYHSAVNGLSFSTFLGNIS
ncbi:hypothetical protein BHE74_00043626 [Ensete ventricosum]|nr:hypothetical protein BHE74_00043626 [Ensete ventricosum]